MQARITFFIGVAVALLGAVQLVTSWQPVRLLTIGVGVFFMLFGWKVGWTRYPRVSTTLGHLAVAIGCLVTAYAAYQIPFIDSPPGIVAVLDLPLLWGLFIILGGYCMITHGYCACCIRRAGGAGRPSAYGPGVFKRGGRGTDTTESASAAISGE
ncbi:MAG: hypothetical protein EG823_07230 [Actinobacteria bacterium]|nr:hypothetical protein [Actinomycetota bacterium]